MPAIELASRILEKMDPLRSRGAQWGRKRPTEGEAGLGPQLDIPGTSFYIPGPSSRGTPVSEKKPVSIHILCRKIGMTQIFIQTGECIPVTVLKADTNRVVQIKTEETDGYSALQVGEGTRRDKLVSKAALGHFQKANLATPRELVECRVTSEEASGFELGQEIKVDVFEKGQRVDVAGTSKGRGTAGVVKRHNFKVKRRTHGTHEAHRHPGAIGAGAYPGRVIKGMKLPGRMGNESVTTHNLEVVDLDADKGLLFVRGAVPGHRNGIVKVRPAVKADS